MVIKRSIKLDDECIGKLKSMCPTNFFHNDTILYYSGQIPMVAFLIIEGSVTLSKNKKIKAKINAGELLGIKELINRTSSSFTAEASAHTSVCYIDRSTAQTIIRQGDPMLASLFQGFVESQVA